MADRAVFVENKTAELVILLFQPELKGCEVHAHQHFEDFKVMSWIISGWQQAPEDAGFEVDRAVDLESPENSPKRSTTTYPFAHPSLVSAFPV